MFETKFKSFIINKILARVPGAVPAILENVLKFPGQEPGRIMMPILKHLASVPSSGRTALPTSPNSAWEAPTHRGRIDPQPFADRLRPRDSRRGDAVGSKNITLSSKNLFPQEV
jgi:hypothetical protein